MTHSYVCHDSVICVTCLIHMRDLAYSGRCARMRRRARRTRTYSYLSHVQQHWFKCDTRSTNSYVMQQHICDTCATACATTLYSHVTQQYRFICDTPALIHMCHIVDSYVLTWRILMCVTTQSYVRHSRFACVNQSCRCMGWLRLVGSLKLWVSFAEYSLFIGLFCKRDL